MKLYRFCAMHGPGHQGYTEELRFDEDLSDADIRNGAWMSWSHGRDFDGATGDIELVDGLAQEDYEELWSEYARETIWPTPLTQ